MPSAEPELPETHERQCPVCHSDRIAPAGHVVTAGGLIKAEYRCETCGLAFFVVRKPLA